MKRNKQVIRSLQDLKTALEDIGPGRPIARKRAVHRVAREVARERVELDEYKTDLEVLLVKADMLNAMRNE